MTAARRSWQAAAVPDVALVTGASRGIGAATARRLAGLGWSVCLGYRTEADAAEAVAADCRSHGVAAVTVAADLADPRSLPAVFAAADALGRLTVLVNNAGIVAHRSRVDELEIERVERMFAVNVVAPVLACGEAVRRMSTTHGGAGGVIVNVSSTAARLGSPGEWVDYAASKGAIDTLTIGLAREVADEGIRVNAVRPGLIDTGIHAASGQPDRVERMAPAVPMGRGGTPEEVAGAVAWLCSEDASYVTGALLDVGGGR
jgi:NAD(P)-dependent dehydrogenase (short-subunit alcohol dehydrogenase family)